MKLEAIKEMIKPWYTASKIKTAKGALKLPYINAKHMLFNDESFTQEAIFKRTSSSWFTGDTYELIRLTVKYNDELVVDLWFDDPPVESTDIDWSTPITSNEIKYTDLISYRKLIKRDIARQRQALKKLEDSQ